MDQFAERLIGKNLQQLIHSEHDVGIVFQDGGITAWTEVKIDLSLGEKPLVVRELQWSEEWLMDCLQ